MTACRHLLPTALLCLPGLATASELPFQQPRPGLYTYSQPSAQQLQQARDAGISTVIDLRGPEEERGYDEQAAAEALGLRYVRLPIANGQALDADNARALQQMLAHDTGPVLLHCASANRAGGLLALTAARHQGLPAEAALELGKAAGLRSLAPRVASQLGLPATHDTPQP